MSCCNGHGEEGATFSSETPHFFKIILDETLRHGRLIIPKKFVRLYGQTLSNSVSIKLPSGSKWKMEVTKLAGQVWLGNGWEKFAKHYSLGLGHMLCFRYSGNSSFEAVIFDTTTCEIDYPSTHESAVDSEVGPVDLEAPLGEEKKSQSPIVDSELLDRRENVAAYEKASSFASEFPFFKIVVRPSYLQTGAANIPVSFARTNLRENSVNAVLKVSNGKKSWPVKIRVIFSRGRCKAYFYSGWTQFARQNHLKVRDVCVFSLLKDTKLTFKVVVFRVGGKKASIEIN